MLEAPAVSAVPATWGFALSGRAPNLETNISPILSSFLCSSYGCCGLVILGDRGSPVADGDCVGSGRTREEMRRPLGWGGTPPSQIQKALRRCAVLCKPPGPP